MFAQQDDSIADNELAGLLKVLGIDREASAASEIAEVGAQQALNVGGASSGGASTVETLQQPAPSVPFRPDVGSANILRRIGMHTVGYTRSIFRSDKLPARDGEEMALVWGSGASRTE